MYAALRNKSKKWLAQSHYNVVKSGLTNLPVDCYVVSVSASSIKLQLWQVPLTDKLNHKICIESTSS
jgi:hypothetical protein